MPSTCPTGGLVTFSGTATADNGCPPVATAADQCDVECIPPPQVSLDLICDPARACANAPITLRWTATNLSSGPATLSVTIDGQTFGPFLDVPPNGTQSGVKNAVMPATCPTSGQVTFSGTATADNGCVPVATDPAECQVECAPPPCVQLSLVCSPEAQCAGGPVTLRWTATNCSTTPEDIVVRVGGRTLSSRRLGVGGVESDTVIVPMPACTAGQRVTFNADVTATNECSPPAPAATDNASCDVLCKVPEVTIVNTATPQVSAGGTVHYVLTIRNPSTTTALENVVVVDDLCSNSNNPRNFNGTCANASTPSVSGSRITWPAFNLAAGGSCILEFDATLIECARCINTATVTGFCSDAPASATDTSRTECTPPEIQRCWLTGGGQSIDHNGDLHSYGGVINPGCSPTAAGGGNWNDLNHTTGAHVKGTEITVVQCGNVPGIPPGSTSPKTPVNFIDFRGTGYITGLNGNKKRTDVFFFGHYEDRAEPGSLGQRNEPSKDRYFLRVYTNQNDPIGSTVHLVDVDGNSATQDPVAILHGNLQIHISGCDKREALPFDRLPPGDAVMGGVTGSMPTEVSFGAAMPNPTLGSTELRYGLPQAAQVSAKIFDVAGRMVRDLGESSVAPGWHSLSWNLNNDAGQRVGPGMYFVRLWVDGKALMRPVTVLR
jgi:uncharacterized repeat protein (TIGR01451 family)